MIVILVYVKNLICGFVVYVIRRFARFIQTECKFDQVNISRITKVNQNRQTELYMIDVIETSKYEFTRSR